MEVDTNTNISLKRYAAEGYASRGYARSLAEFGEPIQLQRSGGYLLKRAILNTPHFDAMGCYPLFFCGDWSGLSEDLAELSCDLVSIALVADPFGDYTTDLLKECFDVVNPFKQHYIVDLECDIEKIGSEHHRKEARRALSKIRVEVCKDPAGFADQWTLLYRNLIQRYGISGIRAFSRGSFNQLLRMPELVVHQAFLGDEIVGAQLFFVQDGIAHCHLGAVSDKGYAAGAFYAMDFFSFDYFSGSARKVDLGGGAGLSTSPTNGLCRYKGGWSSETRPVIFCGGILNPKIYRLLAQGVETAYFPAYRSGEFG